jgi:ABC-2 type transport system permease protein
VRQAVIIDFKRSFIRPATIIALVLFILLGIGLSYLVFYAITVTMKPVGFLGYYKLSNDSLTVVGVAYSAWGERLGGEATIIAENCTTSVAVAPLGYQERCSRVAEAKQSFADILNVSINLSRQLSSVENLRVRVNISTRYGEVVAVASSTPLTTSMTIAPRTSSITAIAYPARAFVSPVPFLPFNTWFLTCRNEVVHISIQTIPVKDVVKIFALIMRNVSVPHIPLTTTIPGGGGDCNFVELYYGYGNITVTNTYELSKALAEVRLKQLAKVSSSGPIFAEAPLEGSEVTIVARFGGAVARAVVNARASNPEIILRTPIVTAMFSQLSTASQFMPIVFLYLAYVLIAKPRSIGALEFLASLPITRRDLYLVRLLAGVLTAFASSGVLVVSTALSMLAIVRYSIDPLHALLLWIGLSLSLVAVYSLFYMISSVLKGGSYLAVAILTYILIWFVMPIAATIIALSIGGPARVADVSRTIAYLNPTILYEYISNYIVSQITGSPITLDTALSITSTALWISLPLIIGWLAFRKASLSG